MKCAKCSVKAAAKFRNKGFCRDHFVEVFENSAIKFIKRERLVEEGDRILVAVSGGKDSSALLSVISMLEGVEIEALYIDLGIEGYSNPMKKAVEELCQRLGTKLTIVKPEEYIGIGMVGTAKSLKRPTCSVCGAFKRYILNRYAYHNHFTKIATGHNMDDVLSFFMKTIPNPQPFPPYSPWRGTAVARIRPLMEMSEKDCMNYVMLKELPFSMLECPLAGNQKMKYAIAEMESLARGSKERMIRFIEEWSKEKTFNINDNRFNSCVECKMPSLSEICVICKWKAILKRGLS